MGANTESNEIARAFFPDEFTGIKDSSGYVRIAWGATVPTDATAGYAKGCIFIHTDGASVTDIIYCNAGTGASCDFNNVAITA